MIHKYYLHVFIWKMFFFVALHAQLIWKIVKCGKSTLCVCVSENVWFMRNNVVSVCVGIFLERCFPFEFRTMRNCFLKSCSVRLVQGIASRLPITFGSEQGAKGFCCVAIHSDNNFEITFQRSLYHSIYSFMNIKDLLGDVDLPASTSAIKFFIFQFLSHFA